MSVSAKAGQYVVVTYRDDLPNRMVFGRSPTLREVTMSTEDAAKLYEQLRVALFG